VVENFMKKNIYQDNLDRCRANYAPLTPLAFLERAAEVYPETIAVIDGGNRKTWAEIHSRCLKMASALRSAGINKGDTVAFLAPNSLASYEVHFGVPMSGAVLTGCSRVRCFGATGAPPGDNRNPSGWGYAFNGFNNL